jgi:tripartite ATP-independent transporter DctM subunit
MLPANEWIALAMFVSFILLLFLGFPVAWTLAGISIVFTVIGIVASVDFGVADIAIDWSYTSLVVDRIWDLMKNWVLVALPLFVFMGLMLDRAGVAEKMLVAFSKLFGKVNGGMAVTVAVIGILLAASTGIVGASVTLLALLGLPVMLRERYDAGRTTGTVTAVGTLGILIPPSIMLVVMGDRLALPVGDLFLGAFIPGVLLGLLYIVYILIAAKFKPSLAPLPQTVQPITPALLWEVIKATVPAIALILAVLGSIFFGIATPTESAGIGAVGAMLLAWFNGGLNLKVVREAGRQTTITTAYIFAIMIGATAFSLVLRGLGGDELIAEALKSLPFGPTGIVIAILLFTFILGFFLDWIEITLIVLPLVLPVVKSLGFDPVWFTVVFAVVLQSSFLTPPVGFSLFYLKGVAPPEVRTTQIYRGIIPFNVMIFVMVVLCFWVKDLILWLPKVAYGN